MANEQNPYIQELLSTNIREIRNQYGYSQQKLAELCDVSTNYISEIEIARKFPSAKTLQKLANVLGLKPYQLFFSGEEWKTFDKYNELMKIISELKITVGEDIEEVIKHHLYE